MSRTSNNRHCCGHHHQKENFENGFFSPRIESPTTTNGRRISPDVAARRSLSAYSLSNNNQNEHPKHQQQKFSRLLPFYLIDSYTTENAFLSSKTIQLLLEIETFCKDEEEISIRILDQNDPFFLYHYKIDYNEYQKIKQKQNLLVTFEKFSTKLIDLFQRCQCQQRSSSSSSSLESLSTNSTFILCIKNLTTTTSNSSRSSSSLIMDVVELNEFKNFIHLSFEIPAANQDYIRKNYCSIFRKLKTETETLQKQIVSLQAKINEMTLAKTKDVQNVKQEFSHQIRFLEEKLSNTEQRFSEERNKWLETEHSLKSFQQKLQQELKLKDEQLENLRKDYERQYQEWKEKLNQEITVRHNRLRELQERNQQLEKEIESLRMERDRNGQTVTENQNETEMLRKDLAKANEIIRKLQNEVKSGQERVDILNEMTQKQEELVLIRETTIERLSNDLKLVLQQLKTKQSDLERIRENEARIRTHSSQLELQLAASKKVINNLSRDLDRLKLEKTKIEDRFSKDLPGDEDDHHNRRDKMSQKQRTSSLPPPQAVTTKIKKIPDYQTELQDHQEDPQECPPPIRNTVLFSHATEVPLKSVNVRTITNATRNSGNVLSSGTNTKRRT